MFSESKPDSISWPAGYDFRFAIRGEGYSVEEFCQWYSDKMSGSGVEDTYGLGLVNLTLGLVKKDPNYIVTARALFAANCEKSKSPKEKKLSELSLKYVESILSGRYVKGQPTKDTVEPVEVKKYSPSKKDFRKIIIGKSAIRVNKDSVIKVQADRVTRDWLQAYNVKSSPWAFSIEHVANWHEGKKVKELVDMTGAEVFPVTGTIAKRFGESWFAPDAEGVYRFELSADKVVHFPSAIVIDDRTAIINDTHGISAVAWDSLDADVVVGCGDAPGKMEAAYYLAERGVNVYVPTDRFIGTLIGTKTKGTIIGSAPVKKTADGAVIGDQPIAFDVNEPIVVSNSQAGYPLRYYDTPYRYFKELERYIGKPMKIIPVDVVEYGKAGVVVDEARKVGAKLIGIRVKSKHEHDAVHSWLKEDRSNRVVLFHTAVYPDGYRLFFEFPQQTSFGDIRPEFE
ncbi:MAG: hypothetical protein ACYS21_09830 [Planctomycetota bacterium]